jgi:hypothetical protein
MQNKITQSTRLLDSKGELIQKGYATSMILDYKRKDVKANKLRLKEWDYYLIQNEDFGVALTVADNAYMGMISASFLDFKNKKEHTTSVISPLPMGRFNMPSSSKSGDVIYQNKRVMATFLNEKNSRRLHMEMKNFEDDTDLYVSIELSREPPDSMVIATPFKEDKKAFYFNQKIVGMAASGEVKYKGKNYEFSSDNSFGLLDWGRGVWTYDNTWYWGAGQGIVNGKTFGFNIGYGFGDTTAATENMLFYDGTAHKLEQVAFHIPFDTNGELDYMKPWTFTSSDQRFEMNFTPILDRKANISALVISSDQHQVFGRFQGKAILDDGTVLEIKDFLGFAEKVRNKW